MSINPPTRKTIITNDNIADLKNNNSKLMVSAFIKCNFNNKTPNPHFPFNPHTRIGLWTGKDPKSKVFEEITINTETGQWIYTLNDNEYIIGLSAHGLLLEMSRRNIISPSSQSINWDKFYVTIDNGEQWWPAREWKFFIAEIFNIPIGVEKGRRNIAKKI